MIGKTGASLPSGPSMLQMAVLNKYGEFRNCDMLRLKSLYQSVYLHCSIEDVLMGTKTRKKRRFLVSSCKY